MYIIGGSIRIGRVVVEEEEGDSAQCTAVGVEGKGGGI